MRKIIIAVLFSFLGMTAMAQQTTGPQQKYSVATNSFWSNWFVQAGVDWTAFYSGQERGIGLNKNPFKDFRSHIEGSVALGKWFTPSMGLRTKMTGLWGKVVTNEKQNSENKFWNLQESALFNLSNLYLGYNTERIWNLIPFVGLSLARNCTYNRYCIGFNLGLLNEFRLTNKLSLNVEAGYNRLGGDFDGITGTHKKAWNDMDSYFYAELGLTFRLGKATWEKTPDVDALQTMTQSELDALNAQLADMQAENERLQNELANKEAPKPTTVTETESVKAFITTPISVFFDLGKTDIAVLKDLVNVKALAKYAIDNNCNLLVTGYADSATGSAEINKTLSEKRANRVAQELVKMGVKRENIQTTASGGVDELEPADFNRRATVQIVE